MLDNQTQKECEDCTLTNLSLIMATVDDWKYCPKCGSRLTEDKKESEDSEDEFVEISINSNNENNEESNENNEQTTEELINSEIEQIKKDLDED